MYYLSLDDKGYVIAYYQSDIPDDRLPEDSPLRSVPSIESLDGIDTVHMMAYKWTENKLLLDREKLDSLLSAEKNENTSKKIDALKAKLSETDYAVIKIAEGAATAEEYADVIEQRRAWRKEINGLEAAYGG